MTQESSGDSGDSSTNTTDSGYSGSSASPEAINKIKSIVEDPAESIFPFNVIDEKIQYVRVEDPDDELDDALEGYNNIGLEFIHDPEVSNGQSSGAVFPANSLDRYFEVDEDEEYADNKLVYVWSGQAVFNLDPDISDEIDQKFWDIMKKQATITVDEGQDYWTELCSSKFHF